MNWIAGTSGQAGRVPERPAAGCPAEVLGEASGGGVPDGLGGAVGGDEVDGGAVAVGLVAAFAGGGDVQVVAAQDPDDVAVDAGVDELGGAAGGHRPRRHGAEGARRGEPLDMTEVGGADGDVEPAAGAADRARRWGGEFVDRFGRRSGGRARGRR